MGSSTRLTAGRAGLFALGFLILGAGATGAGALNEARLALHFKGQCDKCIPDWCGTGSPNAQELPCSGYDTTWREVLYGPTAYLVVVLDDSTAGVGSVRFGIEVESVYEGLISAWYPCGDTEQPQNAPGGEPWPASGSSNRIAWDPDNNCQRTTIGNEGVHAVAGAFYIRPYGEPLRFSITPDSTLSEPAMVVGDCAGTEGTVSTPGGAIGYLVPGFNPCTDSVPALPSTWGRLKSLYR